MDSVDSVDSLWRSLYLRPARFLFADFAFPTFRFALFRFADFAFPAVLLESSGYAFSANFVELETFLFVTQKREAG